MENKKNKIITVKWDIQKLVKKIKKISVELKNKRKVLKVIENSNKKRYKNKIVIIIVT